MTSKVLFVCLGNICRSPTAEAVFRHKVNTLGLIDSIQLDSCGTAAYHAGEKPDPRAMSAAKERGYSMAGQRARGVNDEDFHEFDHILAMDRSNQKDLLERCPKPLRHKIHLFLEFSGSARDDVPDPYYGGPQGFDQVLDLVEEACDGLLDWLQDK